MINVRLIFSFQGAVLSSSVATNFKTVWKLVIKDGGWFVFDCLINTNIKISLADTTPFLKTLINLKLYLIYFVLFVYKL